MEKHSDGCKYCNGPLYIKVQQIAQPVLAPLTPADVAWDTWVSKSGMSYVPLEHRFCPICGCEIRSQDKATEAKT